MSTTAVSRVKTFALKSPRNGSLVSDNNYSRPRSLYRRSFINASRAAKPPSSVLKDLTRNWDDSWKSIQHFEDSKMGTPPITFNYRR